MNNFTAKADPDKGVPKGKYSAWSENPVTGSELWTVKMPEERKAPPGDIIDIVLAEDEYVVADDEDKDRVIRKMASDLVNCRETTVK